MLLSESKEFIEIPDLNLTLSIVSQKQLELFKEILFIKKIKETELKINNGKLLK